MGSYALDGGSMAAYREVHDEGAQLSSAEEDWAGGGSVTLALWETGFRTPCWTLECEDKKSCSGKRKASVASLLRKSYIYFGHWFYIPVSPSHPPIFSHNEEAVLPPSQNSSVEKNKRTHFYSSQRLVWCFFKARNIKNTCVNMVLV